MIFLLLACLAAISACSPSQNIPEPLESSTTQPVRPTQTQPDFHKSRGGGEPRSASYWLQWNSCAPDNRSEMAAANGGRAAGWIILDDLLDDPGILLGELQVGTCEEGINLLQNKDVEGFERGGDMAYQLAAQLLAAQLNLAVGAEYCPAGDQAVAAGQLLLIGQGFNGRGGYLGPPAFGQDVETAQILVEQLGDYNSGQLCR